MDKVNNNQTQGSVSGKVLSAGNRSKSAAPVEQTGKFHGGGRDNCANPKYSTYADTNFNTKHKA